MRNLIILFILILSTLTARSQDFDYTVTTDSVAWQELNNQTILNSNDSAWKFSYRIAIGFPFTYLGQTFDSLSIETNGYVVFDHNRSYAFTAFHEFRDRIDSLGNHAIIGYERSGNTGNRSLKIQVLNAGKSLNGIRSQSWQICIKEAGTIELRIGPGDYANDITQHLRVGLINQNMDTPVRGYFIEGNPENPSGRPVNDTNPDTPLLHSIPSQGYRYTFSPNVN